MIGRDCRCPGCGTCDSASEVERLRKLADSKNGQRIVAERRARAAERERDELKTRLAHAEADAEQAVHNEAFMERQKIVAYIRVRLAHATMEDRFGRERGLLIELVSAVEAGEHEG